MILLAKERKICDDIDIILKRNRNVIMKRVLLKAN